MRPPLRGPWIDPENNETRLSQTHSGIVKFFEFPVRIPEISHRAFHLCWQRHHSPKVMNVTGFSQIKGRYKDQKRAMIRGITAAFVNNRGGDASEVDIIISEVELSDWASGGALCSDGLERFAATGTFATDPLERT